MKFEDNSKSLQQWDKLLRYSKWMYNTYKEYIGQRVLDVGAGVGNMAQFYIRKDRTCIGTDVFEHQIDFMNQRFLGQNFEAKKLDIANGDLKPFMQYQFDTAICINVLEHIKDDLTAITNMKKLLISGGHIILLVPAINKMYCYMDKNAGHYKRYNKGELRALADQAGLQVVKNHYFNFFGIVPYWYKGRFTKNPPKGESFGTSLKTTDSKIYNLASVILEPLERMLPPPIGISELIILKKV